MINDDDVGSVKCIGINISNSKNCYEKNISREPSDIVASNPCILMDGNFLYGFQQT